MGILHFSQKINTDNCQQT